MAKGKHSPALFEVVHGKKRFDKSAANLRTPNWWFKGRHRGPAVPVMEPVEAPAFADEADPTLRGLPSPTAPRPVEPEPEAETVPAEYESAVDDPTAFPMPQPRRHKPLVARSPATSPTVRGWPCRASPSTPRRQTCKASAR